MVSIRELKERDGQEVVLQGWLEGKRLGGGIAFLLVRDGTGVCQCVVEAGQGEAFERAGAATQESSLRVTGRARLEARAPGGVELAVSELEVLHVAEGYPIARKAHGVDFLMNHRHLWLRSRRQTLILRIRHTIVRAARAFFDGRAFTLIDTPILTPGAAEGAGTLFPVDYFGETAYLAQTGQLYLESACMALGKVYCFGPTFRAEKSKTRRHLTEFWMIEPEIAFARLDDLADLAEAFILSLVEAVLREHREDLVELGRDPAPLEAIRPPFPRMTYTEAVEFLHSPATRERIERDLEADRRRLGDLLREIGETEKKAESARKGWRKDKLDQRIVELRETARELDMDLQNRGRHAGEVGRFSWGNDLGGDEETVLSKAHDRPIIVTRYPKQAKAFYMKPDPADPRVVLNLDVLAPEGYGEIVGGSQREDDLEALQRRMNEEGMDPAPYEWYLDLRRYGSVPHGGFGLGIERTVAWLCGLRHIRETIPFPRLMGRMVP